MLKQCDICDIELFKKFKLLLYDVLAFIYHRTQFARCTGQCEGDQILVAGFKVCLHMELLLYVFDFIYHGAQFARCTGQCERDWIIVIGFKAPLHMELLRELLLYVFDFMDLSLNPLCKMHWTMQRGSVPFRWVQGLPTHGVAPLCL